MVDGGDENIEEPVSIVIGNRQPHAVFIRADSGGRRAVAEGAVAVVPVEAAGIEITRDNKVGMAVAIEVGESRAKAPNAGSGVIHGPGRKLVIE